MEAETGSRRAGLMLLGFAGLLLVGSVGYASFRDTAPAPAAAPTPQAGAAATIEQLQAQVRIAPSDAAAWQKLGAALFDRGDHAGAAAALERAAALAPGRADLWSALGEARVLASARDPMPPPALAAFRRALEIDPKDPRARYFAAVSRDLSGDHKGAIDDWLALLADTPPGAPWEADLRRTIEQVGRINGIEVADRIAAVKPAPAHPVAGAGIPGPDAEQMRAAAALPPSAQDEMARGMVARLEEKLKADPANLSGWGMLMRSRMALGEPDKAKAALASAVAANPAAKAQLESDAAALGVPGL